MQIDTMAFLENIGLSSQSAEDTEANMIDYLVKNGFSSSPPDKLYRYRNPIFMVDEIANHYIHYTSATELGDPYECHVSSKKMLKKIGFWDNELFDDSNEAESIMRDLDTVLREKLKVCCFTERCDSFSMWDQYADGHRGVCIQYNTKKLKELNKVPMQVKYCSKSFKKFNRNSVDGAEKLLEYMAGCTLTKNRDYKHEREWRLFGSGGSSVSIEDSIECVYIGSRCSKGKINVIKTCKNQGIDVIKLTVKDDEYAFNSRKL